MDKWEDVLSTRNKTGDVYCLVAYRITGERVNRAASTSKGGTGLERERKDAVIQDVGIGIHGEASVEINCRAISPDIETGRRSA
jgi:hypothetical protein